MAQIDKFIRTIHRFHADQLILASGERVTLAIGAERRPLTAEAATRQQVEGLLREIVPGDMELSVAEEGSHEFPYASPSGSVRMEVLRENGSLRLQVVPLVSDEEVPLPTPQAPEAAAPVVILPPTAISEEIPAGAPVTATPATAPSPSPKARAIEALFVKMVQEKCSDLHLSTGSPPLFRKDGEIVQIGEAPPLTGDQVRDLVLSVASDVKRAEFEETHDTDFAHEIPGVARFRCNLFMDRHGAGGVFRVIPTKIPTVQELGLSKQIVELCHLQRGLVLVTGPTGSGKSTTLAAMIEYINRTRSDHIITIEDPIEFVYPNGKCLVNQREVRVHTQGFKRALRAALREDPDIVLVGEMRDLETVAIAIETAETGHLVFGTLHTTTAPSTVDRIIDQFPSDRQSQVRTMLSESLKAVIAQTLCKKKGGGRVAAQEVLFVTSAISNLIREAKTFQIPSIMQTGKALGMVTLNDALLDLVKRGVVDPQEAYAKSVAKADFKSVLERNGIKIEGP